MNAELGDEGYVSIAGRRSYIDLIVGRFIDEQQFPYFSDYQLKFAYPLGEKHHLTLNSFAATDHFHVEESTSVEVAEVVSVDGRQSLEVTDVSVRVDEGEVVEGNTDI